MLLGTIWKRSHSHGMEHVKSKTLRGYIDTGLIEVHNVEQRHTLLVTEMGRRGYRHKSPVKPEEVSLLWEAGKVNAEHNIRELSHRCHMCANIQQGLTDEMPRLRN